MSATVQTYLLLPGKPSAYYKMATANSLLKPVLLKYKKMPSEL